LSILFDKIVSLKVKQKCTPYGVHEKVLSALIVATQSLPKGMRIRGNTFYQNNVSFEHFIYDCVAL
jgi:hypothetical protein